MTGPGEGEQTELAGTDALEDAVTAEVDVVSAWTVRGSVPPGLAACLLLAAVRTGWHGPVRIEVAADGALGRGPASLTASGFDPANGRRRCATLRAADGSASITATIREGRSDDERPPAGLRTVTHWPEDVPAFRGGRPGPAALFEVRPLPAPDRNELSADAWVRPNRPDEGVRSELLAVDSWLAGAQLAYLRRHADDPDGGSLPAVDWRRATFHLDLDTASPPGPRWLLRRLRSDDPATPTIDVGAVEVVDGAELRPRIRFEIERSVIAPVADGS
ncbi:MAG: hypothetical protein AAF962_18310 [Actinomycetota bacterium]